MVYGMNFDIFIDKTARLDGLCPLPNALARWLTTFFGEKGLMVSGY